jgi:hypothetical protein
MNSLHKKLIQKQMDELITSFIIGKSRNIPNIGWIQSIRSSLGMSLK